MIIILFMKKAFINATIYPVDEDTIENGTLLVEGSKIIDVGKGLSTDGYEIIDCRGLFITPGFIDPHTHTGVWEEGAGPGPGNHDGNEMSEPITPYTRALDSVHPEDYDFADARMGGVTTLGITHGSANAIGGQFVVMKSYGNVADEMVIREPAGLKMALGENPKRVGDTKNRAPTSRMGVAYLIRKAFYDAIEYQKDWDHFYLSLANEQDDKKKELIREPRYDIGKEALIKVLNKEIPVRCHAHRADDIITAIRLSEEFGYDLVIEHATEGYKVVDTLVEKNIPVVVGPAFGGRAKRELIHMTLANSAIIHNKGGFVSLITDSPFNPIHGLRDNLIWAIREGLPENEALKLITINPAKILGVDDRVGSLKAGKDADFLLFNGDPLDSRNKVIKTYIDGKLVFENKPAF